MNKISTHFGKLLFVLTIFVVLVFQGYWIYISFQNKKEEILERTRSEMIQLLVNNMLNEPILKQKLSKKNKSNKKEKIEVFISEPTKTMVNESFKQQNTAFYRDEKLDVLLYISMKSTLKKMLNKDAEITILYEGKKIKRIYPKNAKTEDKNTTAHVNSLLGLNTTYRIHIENMKSLVISEIKETIIFSVLYVLLFLVTIFILFKSLIFNQKLLKNKEIFTRNMTHELKIPISTILIAAEGLEKHDIINQPENAKKYAGMIQRAGRQLSQLVESILQHARSDHNTEKLLLTSINLAHLLEDVKENLSGIIHKKEAKISITNIDQNIHVKGNYEQLTQVFSNLIDNSLKYSANSPLVLISAEKTGNNVLIRIKDNGLGIPEKYTEDIFSPYFRIVNDDTHDIKGFGLGLSFVRKSLMNQGASIKIIRQKTEGTTMEIKIATDE
ncbi:sensor histidine kinase [Chryseobacterium piperi]|nr:HAMP domain-containing sensor histidine kinase [Chryseobacterium piperi]